MYLPGSLNFGGICYDKELFLKIKLALPEPEVVILHRSNLVLVIMLNVK